MVSQDLEQASEGANGSSNRIMDIRERCTEIVFDLQALSHELHSSKLQYLGIVSALRAFCQEFSEQQSVNIDFTHENVPLRLPPGVSLCLFRIAQEALHNAVKHSGKREFTVHLLGTQGEIELEVRDTGAGFDVEAAKTSRGLGLMSMQERVHLVKGSLCIESKLNRGTRIITRVPVGAVSALDAMAENVGRT